MKKQQSEISASIYRLTLIIFGVLFLGFAADALSQHSSVQNISDLANNIRDTSSGGVSFFKWVMFFVGCFFLIRAFSKMLNKKERTINATGIALSIILGFSLMYPLLSEKLLSQPTSNMEIEGGLDELDIGIDS